MNGNDSEDDHSLKGFYAYKNTFEDDTVWMDIPRHVTFIHTMNPYLDPVDPDYESMSATSLDSPVPFETRPAISWRTHNNVPSHGGTPTIIRPRYAPTSEPRSFPTSEAGTPISPPVSVDSYSVRPILNDSAASTPAPLDPYLSSRYDSHFDHDPHSNSAVGSRQLPPRSQGHFSTDNEHEIPYLLRWFSEGPGFWMDLFDLGTYFASHVPVTALDNPLLKYAAVACAAKALARVHGRKPVKGGSVARQARMELYPDASLVDWKHKAEVYYDTAVSLLLQAVKVNAATTPDDSDCEYDLRNNNDAYTYGVQAPKRRKTSNNATFVSNTDETLAASAILCVYEFLDTSLSPWESHLNGAKSLLVLAQERMMPFYISPTTSDISLGSSSLFSKARRATFWNIARQDMLAAFINQTRTRLDTENLSLWRDAGLQVDDQGYITPSNTIAKKHNRNTMKEDSICNALVWLMAKLVNYMAFGDELGTDDMGILWAGVPQRTLLDYWRSLRRQFQIWHDGLPTTFQPAAQLAPSQTTTLSDNESMFTEKWYSIPMCASTMQTYHMSQILLFMNKPHESTQGRSTVCARMNSYQSVLAACEKHSREIVCISLARSDEAVRIHSVQPLFTAGQCLSDDRDRQVVLNLLRGVETDIGWATDYRVQQLMELWQWEEQETIVP